ncbi:MAG: 4Fe-4S dicluster domain-containing protein [Candidatus Aminicenantes bacterium]|nr:4Fe-4S dicluster domain-containing protein [Candidatus Aminicenantes bacterium]
MLSFTGKIVFGLVLLFTFTAFAVPVYYRIRIVIAGLPNKRFNNPIRRIWGALSKILLQRCTLKNERAFTGLMHVFIFYSALTFDTMSVNHILEGFFPHFFLFGDSYLGLFCSMVVDIMAILVMIGITFFIVRRFIIRPKAYQTTPMDSFIIYFLITVVTLSYLYFEIFSIAFNPGTERLSFLGIFFGNILNVSGMTVSAVHTHFYVSWWLHILVVLGFIAYVPHSKYFHMFAGSFNVLVRNERPHGELCSLDLENIEVFGAEKAVDFTWKDLLDEFACMECGRCQDVCPAFSTEKPLSPKMIIFNLKNHLLENKKAIIKKDRDNLNNLMDSVFTEDEIWTCTTCGACMHVCPVEIEHVSKIVSIRQSQVLMESKFPKELNAFFRNMETNSNPWGIGFADRANWAEGLDVKMLHDVPDTEYLLWIGCAGAFDEQGQKITKAMVSILNKSGIKFGILGIEEKCCGDSAKRLGNEYLFQILAGDNIETFKKNNIKKIIVTCPHGYNTFKNEYPKLLDLIPNLSDKDKVSLQNIEVFHHVQFIQHLLETGALTLKDRMIKELTYHDSCYLGRHNSIIKEPRDILLKLTGKKIIELDNNKEHSFCCGAGGGLMWTEENLGTRINHKRTDEVIKSGAEIIATSCPFCQTMLQDGLKDKEKETIKVEDIAQLVDKAT